MKRVLAAVFTSALLVGVASSPALASDHLANASDPDHAGFNPVAQNPSEMSGDKSKFTTVPGEGDPSAGVDQETPAVDLNEVDGRSGGHGNPQVA